MSMPPPPPRPVSCVETPRRRIFTAGDLERWRASPARSELLCFVRALAEAVRGVHNDAEVSASPAVEAVVAVLSQLQAGHASALARALKDLSRQRAHAGLGGANTAGAAGDALRQHRVSHLARSRGSLNHACAHAQPHRHARLVAEAPELMRLVLPPELHTYVPELCSYFTDAFGNSTRIDYGTGHETAFAAWLACLARLGVFAESDLVALVTRCFTAYVALMRLLQTTYWLEPAGSHGVWGLDDYSFLPFLWGASQLEGQQDLRPSCIHDDSALAQGAPQFLYLSAVAFVRSVKKSATLRETSPMLSDIAQLPSWARVTQGMLRMYEAEVLDKLPIAQHFLFGKLLRFDA